MSSSLHFNAPQAQVFGGPRDRSYPAPLELLHVSVFHTGPGVNELVRFYQVALNLRFVYTFKYPTFEFIALSADDENHRLGIVNAFSENIPGNKPTDLPTAKVDESIEPRNSPMRSCRIEHTSWLYRDFEAVLLTAKHIHKELGIWPRTTRHGGRDLTIDYNDPDGNRVEMLSQFRSRNEILWGFHQLAQTADPTKRSYGESYMAIDMQKLMAMYDAGVPLTNLEDREYCRKLVQEGKL